MKKHSLPRPGGPAGQNALRGGAYSLAVTAVVLAILVVLNILAAALPTTLTRYDISAAQLYSVTSNTRAVAAALTQDVSIYWLVQAGQEDAVLENLLGRYESLSDHIRVEKKNPDVYPTFAKQYTDETVYNNSLVVESGGRSRFISYEDIYPQELDAYSYSASYSFDGEGALTSAIHYVTSEELPQVYLLEGHGEQALPSTFAQQLEKENIETATLSLLTADAVPEEADCVMLYAPQSDLSAEEKDLLADYAAQGGKLLVVAGPLEDTALDNLYALLADYGVQADEGVVVEGDREYYAFQDPVVLLPDMASDTITDPLIAENYYPVLPIARGLTVGADSGDGTVTTLLTTSADAYSKLAGYAMTDYAKEEGDIDGPFALAVSIDTAAGGRIVWFASSYFLEDVYNATSSGANVELGVNALGALVGQSEAMSIRSKSLDYNYLTISDSTASLLKTLLTGVFPLAYLGVGIVVVLRRRRLQNAQD